MLHRSKIAPKIETSINSQISLHFPIRSLLPGQHRSPPLSRGILRRGPGVEQHAGIIPALAGNTFFSPATTPEPQDHPRSRGEYRPTTDIVDGTRGSSPLSRGIPLYLDRDEESGGIIPALAGNTITRNIYRIVDADHPRSRGEYHWMSVQCTAGQGSSPLSRGIRASQRGMRPWLGIIPALAGNTASTPAPGRWSGDHPRSRGEY